MWGGGGGGGEEKIALFWEVFREVYDFIPQPSCTTPLLFVQHNSGLNIGEGIQSGCRTFERRAVQLIRSPRNRGGGRGYSFGPNVKKPTSWAKRGPNPRPPLPQKCGGNTPLFRHHCLVMYYLPNIAPPSPLSLPLFRYHSYSESPPPLSFDLSLSVAASASSTLFRSVPLSLLPFLPPSLSLPQSMFHT